MGIAALPILLGLSCASGDPSPLFPQPETQLWFDLLTETARDPRLRLVLLGDGEALKPTPSHGRLATLASGAPVAVSPGLWLELGAVTGGSRFLAAPPLSSAAQRMSAFRRMPRGVVALLF